MSRVFFLSAAPSGCGGREEGHRIGQAVPARPIPEGNRGFRERFGRGWGWLVSEAVSGAVSREGAEIPLGVALLLT